MKSTDQLSKSWLSVKEEGNQLFSKGQYPEANDLYKDAISLITKDFNCNDLPEGSDDTEFSPEVRTDLAKLYSNCAASLYQQAMSGDKPNNAKLRQALQDGEAAVKYDDKFDKGHFRCALCLAALGEQDGVVPYAARILDLYKESGKDHMKDEHLVTLLHGCQYFTRNIRTMPLWDKVLHKANVKVIGKEKYSQYHIFEPNLIDGEVKVTLILRPGHYKLTEGFLIHNGQEVQILGDVRNDHDHVTIECTGTIYDRHICHLFHVHGGKLSIRNIRLRQAVEHPNLHAVYVENAGEAVLDNCQCFSKWSGCLAANGASNITVRNCTFDRTCGGVIVVGRSVGHVEHCTLNNTAMIGVEARDGGFVTVSDTKISNCGSQAIAIHAEAKGAKIERCVLTNNSTRHKGQEPAITCADSTSSVNDCELIDNVGGGIMTQNGASVTVSDTIFRRGRYGLSASMKGEARLENSKILGCIYGLCIIYNQAGKIVLENNTINVSQNDIIVSPDDIGPDMIGRQHEVEVVTNVSVDSMRLGLMAEKKIKKNDHYGQTEPLTDPRTSNARDKRTCGPCGLTQGTIGTRFMMCSGCHVTWYCSKKCQKKDWKLHKEICQMIQTTMKH